MVFVSHVSHAFASAYCSLVVTCWERADLLAFVGDIYLFFGTFLCGILGQVWYLIVSFSDLCHLSYFVIILQLQCHLPLTPFYHFTVAIGSRSYSLT